jgi:undecaprenyl-diphosphatase
MRATPAWALLFMAVLQGFTELFPVSSLGHSVLVPALLHLRIDRAAPWFLPFLVVLHLGTATALVLYFWKDWWSILRSLLRTRGRPVEAETRLFWLLVLGTVPAGLLGLLLVHFVRSLFAGFTVAAVFLLVNGVMLLGGDRLKKREARHRLDDMPWRSAFLIGVAQATALIPGISRSGATLVAGLARGLDYEAAARFSFLLSAPIIAAAGLLETPKLFHAGVGIGPLLPVVFGAGLLAGVCAWLSSWFLMHYFHRREVTALRPFGLYCLAAGAGAFVLRALAL